MCCILAFTILIMPFSRDLFTHEFLVKNAWVVYLNIILMYCFNPKLFSPFINYVLNKKMPPHDRTAINSVTFIGSTLSSSILINIFAPLYSMTFSNDLFLRFYPYNKYVTFFLLAIVLLLGQSFMKNITFESKWIINW